MPISVPYWLNYFCGPPCVMYRIGLVLGHQQGDKQMTKARSVLAVAAVVHDQDAHTDADLAFLDAMSRADREWLDALNAANITWGGGSETWQTVKRLATRTRDQAYAEALAALEANDFEDADLLQAAE